MGKIVKLIGSGVGLAAEAIAARKQPQRSPSSQGNGQLPDTLRNIPTEGPPGYNQRVFEVSDEKANALIASGQAVTVDDRQDRRIASGQAEDESDSSDEDDERDWALDEAAGEDEPPVASPNGQEPKKKYALDATPTIQSLGAIVLSKFPPPPRSTPQLRCPVIIPQRRPGASGRGFIRAYAPDLAEFGIPQEAFLSFLKVQQEASKASPLLNVVYVGAGIVGCVPHGAAMITSVVVSIAVGACIKHQESQRTNSFLDEMNEKVYKPRGLYAMIMKYNPNANTTLDVQQMDTSSLIANRATHENDFFRKMASGETQGELEMPEAAPLVFPALDEVATSVAQSGDVEKRNAFMRSTKFVSNYYDKRAQMDYATKNPNSTLAIPADQRPNFAARVADPNHPAFQGSWLTLFSGGKIKPSAKGEMNGEPPARRGKRGRKGKGRKKGRKMKSNLLYLMIVNLPSDQELAAAKHQLEMTRRQN